MRIPWFRSMLGMMKSNKSQLVEELCVLYIKLESSTLSTGGLVSSSFLH